MNEHPVYVHFGGAKVRVGTAIADGDGSFTLNLGGLSLGPGQPASSRGGAPAASGTVFPNYGRSKGAPIAGASMGDLEFYANGARRSLNDASKSRWHAKERELLDAIEAEITRQGGTVEPQQSSWGQNPTDDTDSIPF